MSVMAIGTNDYTLSLWIKDAVFNGTDHNTLISIDWNAHVNSTGGSMFTANGSSYINLHDQLGTTKTITTDFVYGADSDLHNYVVSRKGTTTRIFVDNVEKGSHVLDPPGSPAGDDTNYIGAMMWSNSLRNPLQGNITKFEVWLGTGYETWPPPVSNTATSGATNSFILTGASKSLTDVNNAGVSLELIGSPTFSDSNGVELPGDPAKHIKIPQSIMNFGTNDFTVSIWIKDAVYGYNPGASTSIYSGWSYGATILNMGFNAHVVGDGTSSFMLTTNIENNNKYMYVRDHMNRSSGRTHEGTNFEYGADLNLHNYVVTKKGNNVRIFVDGIEEITYTVNDSTPQYPDAGSGDNFIGNTVWNGVPARGLQGNVTKVEIWNDTGFDTWTSN